MNPRPLSRVLALPLLAALAHAAGDWPQYHGPGGDRVVSAELPSPPWGEAGPAVAWRVDTARGFSSFAVAGGHAYTLESREVDGRLREVCVARDAATGEERWAVPLDPAEYDGGGDAGAHGNQGGDGPRSTPSVVDGSVYVLDARLNLTALDAETGEVRWARDVAADHDGRDLRWQNAASPLVVGGRVFLAGGGPGQSLLAFDAASGELAWKTGDEEPTHATPVAADLHGQPTVLFLVRSGLVALDPADGSELWRQAYDYRTSTAASPVVHENVVYVSAGYGVGAAAFVVLHEDGEWSTQALWRKRNDLMNHWSTPVAKDGHLYGMFGFKEYGEAPLQCVELATGEVKWSQEGFGPGNAIVVGEAVVALSDSGEVVVVDARPDGYHERARAQVLDGKCWSSPAWSDGRIYVRSTEQGACLDLSTGG